MPSFLGITTAQPYLHSHLGSLKALNFSHCGAWSTSFISRVDKGLGCWKSSKKCNFNDRHIRLLKGRLVVRAVATLEESRSLRKTEKVPNGCVGSDADGNSSLPTDQVEDGDDEELGDREKLRRMRISKANKGNTPWNKGRKHSPETLKRIKERTRLAMQNPKVKMKLANLGHAQSEETRVKIGVGVRMGWQKRRDKLMVQESIYYEWQNLIAEASRRGYVGEEELQWNSYQILNEQLQQEWLVSVEERKMLPRSKSKKRAPKSPEQRRKIAEAIAAKWGDPVYREKVRSGMSKFHGSPAEAEKRRRRKVSDSPQSTKPDRTNKKASDTSESARSESNIRIQKLRARRSNKPLYKDPLASSKLEMIKNIRAQRADAEIKKVEAIERARLLIAEAEKAANALEVAAKKSPIAQASLIETRMLIAEAINSLESIENDQATTNENTGLSSAGLLVSQVEEVPSTGHKDLEQSNKIYTNDIHTLVSEDFENFSFQTMVNGKDTLVATSSSEYGLSAINLESFIDQSDSTEQPGYSEPNGKVKLEMAPPANGALVKSLEECKPSKPNGRVTKKWVCGRLVEVTD